MTNKEKENLKNEIAYRNAMTRRVGKISKFCLLFFLLFGALAYWGFSGMHDNFLNVSDDMRNVLKWIGLVLAVPTGIFSLLFFVSYRNSKKMVLTLIDKLQGRSK